MSTSSSKDCSVSERVIGRAIQTLRIQNDFLSATILPDKGGDIYELVHRPSGIDILWKSPWGLKEPGRGLPSNFQSKPAWIESYPGGWQMIFPNGGAECIYKGVELNFHGEASMAAWDYEILEMGGQSAEVRLATRLRRSPFRIERTLRVEAGRPVLFIRERITNESGEEMDYMWGHHPAFGAPFIGAGCRIDVGAHRLWADDLMEGTFNPLNPNSRYAWPMAEKHGSRVDLSKVPGENSPRALMAYFEDFESGWYAITNPKLGFGFGLAWPVEVFPFAWFWQEMNASAGFPWYKGVNVMAIEPFTSVPGQGLAAVMEKTNSQRTLAAGESIEVELCAVFYESNAAVKNISPQGVVSKENHPWR